MIRRLLPYSLSCAGTLIVLPSVAANSVADSQVATGLSSNDIGGFFLAIGAALLLAFICSVSGSRLLEIVAGKIDRKRLHRILRAVSPDQLHDFLLPGAYGGLTRIDHALLVPGGILCIQSKNYSGTIYGDADKAQWTVADGKHRQTFLNPLIQNAGRTRSLQKFVANVPVASLVVFRDTAKFVLPMPDNAIQLRDLALAISRFRFESCDTAKLAAAWLELKAAALTDEESRKDFHAQLSFS